MRFGISIGPRIPVTDCVELAIYAERQGFDFVWVADECPTSPYRDPFLTLGAIAAKTSRVKLGQSVSNPYSRHPALLAVAASTLNEISGGRTVLGLGAGGSLSLPPMGIAMWNEPLRTVREAIISLRRLFRGEEVTMENNAFKMNKVSVGFSKGNIPIYLAARKAGMLRLIGELADGGLVSVFPPELLPTSLMEVEKGASRSGKLISEIDVTVLANTSLAGNDKEALDAVRVNAAYTLSDAPEEMARKVGISVEEQQKIRAAIRSGGPQVAKALVQDWMVEAVAIAGRYGKVVDKCMEYIENGATQLLFSQPFGPDPREGLRILGEKVLRRIRND